MASYKNFLLCIFLFFQTVLYQFVETCTTVDGGMGVCVSLATCAPYVMLLQEANPDTAALRKLRDANCGYRGNAPYVCCPLSALPTTPPIVIPDKSIPTSDFITAFPEPPVCGFSNVSSSRVVGRVNAELGAFPWMTLLGYHYHGDGSTNWLCAGSLISQHHVLTAAHCIKEDLYVVRLGELDFARDDDGATPIDILIKNKIQHEKFNANSFTNDIGILVLERDVDFTNFIRPICIPTLSDLRDNSFVDYNLLLAGWGDTIYGALASPLQVLQMRVLENSYCAQIISRFETQDAIRIDERVLCARFKKGELCPRKMDGGGPLMQPDHNPVDSTTYFYQIGVVSYGPHKCGEENGLPDIFTRVTSFVPWLHKQVLGLDELIVLR